MYVIAKFKLNSLDLKDDWKKMSDMITEDMNKNADGLIFRDSAIDEDGNVLCILKWESADKQAKFEAGFEEMMKDKQDMMEEFARIGDMSTMTKEKFNLV